MRLRFENVIYCNVEEETLESDTKMKNIVSDKII